MLYTCWFAAREKWVSTYYAARQKDRVNHTRQRSHGLHCTEEKRRQSPYAMPGVSAQPLILRKIKLVCRPRRYQQDDAVKHKVVDATACSAAITKVTLVAAADATSRYIADDAELMSAKLRDIHQLSLSFGENSAIINLLRMPTVRSYSWLIARRLLRIVDTK